MLQFVMALVLSLDASDYSAIDYAQLSRQIPATTVCDKPSSAGTGDRPHVRIVLVSATKQFTRLFIGANQNLGLHPKEHEAVLMIRLDGNNPVFIDGPLNGPGKYVTLTNVGIGNHSIVGALFANDASLGPLKLVNYSTVCF